MALSKSQQAIWAKARSLGAGDQAVALTDGICSYLIARIAKDLELMSKFPEFPEEVGDFFEPNDLDALTLDAENPKELFDRLIQCNRDADMYFACLSSLHRARLKYEGILETQPMPTLEQIGPRGLLQYGKLSPSSLVSLLFWRKWFFDIDNRAGQETGYLFEPVIAYAVGGTPVPARKSPVKRHKDNSKGRQIDCLLENKAYEVKIRVTIAASGQGRWREELDYPVDCKNSGFQPVLLVLDGTENPKLEELVKAFKSQGGEVFLGEAAWNHLDDLAGETMSVFLEKYVRAPIQNLIDSGPKYPESFAAVCDKEEVVISIGDEKLVIGRREAAIVDDVGDEIPEDIGDNIPA